MILIEIDWQIEKVETGAEAIIDGALG